MTRKKKLYNPFKMWGAWVGLVIGIILGVIMCGIALKGGESFSGFILTTMLYPFIKLGFPDTTFIFLGIVINAIIGFIIGWAIHSIIRKAR